MVISFQYILLHPFFFFFLSKPGSCRLRAYCDDVNSVGKFDTHKNGYPCTMYLGPGFEGYLKCLSLSLGSQASNTGPHGSPGFLCIKICQILWTMCELEALRVKGNNILF